MKHFFDQPDHRDPVTKIADYAYREIEFFIDDLKFSEVASYPSDLDSFDEWMEILEKIRFALYEVANEYPGEGKFIHKKGPTILETRGEFTIIIDTGIDFDKNGYKEYRAKIREGLELFGKHFQSLWI